MIGRRRNLNKTYASNTHVLSLLLPCLVCHDFNLAVFERLALCVWLT